jgi:hypothetical protein
MVEDVDSQRHLDVLGAHRRLFAPTCKVVIPHVVVRFMTLGRWAAINQLKLLDRHDIDGPSVA